MFAYGFEDLTAAEWSLLEALAGRAEVTVSLPYEPGRVAFAALRTTADDLAGLADRIEELPPRFAEIAHPAIAHVERRLFEDDEAEAPRLEGAVRFFEGAGVRGALELVAEDVLELVRGGTAPERIGIVCPALERWRAPLETALSTLGIPYALEARLRLPQTPYGAALLALLRYAWLDGERDALFAYLRSPYSGLQRANVDFLEGRLRGRAIAAAERVEAELEALRGASVPAVEALRAGREPVAAVRALAEAMLGAAFGTEAPPVGEGSRSDLRAFEAVRSLLDELDDWAGLAGGISREEVVAALERATVRGASAGEPGRVSVTDLSRVRTRRLDAVYVLGLEEGSLPRRGDGSPFLDDERAERSAAGSSGPTRRAATATSSTPRGARRGGSRSSARPPPTRAARASRARSGRRWRRSSRRRTLARWTRRRALSALTWPLETAPSERERLRALALLAADPTNGGEARGVARANGWERRLDRALKAFDRRTRLRHPLVLRQLGDRALFNVTELERFADCSSAWFFDRVVDPRRIDGEIDAKLRGSVAHTTLHRFFAGLPKEVGSDRVVPERLDDALAFLRRCLEQAIEGQRIEMTPMERRELTEGLWRDLEAAIRTRPPPTRRSCRAASRSRSAPTARRRSSSAASSSGRGSCLGKDRPDRRRPLLDARDRPGLQGGQGRALGAADRAGAAASDPALHARPPRPRGDRADRRRLPAARGRPQAARAPARGRGAVRLRAERLRRRGRVLAQVERSRTTALELAQRIRGGDVRHDPKGEGCPAWCDLWTMCRVRRA